MFCALHTPTVVVTADLRVRNRFVVSHQADFNRSVVEETQLLLPSRIDLILYPKDDLRSSAVSMDYSSSVVWKRQWYALRASVVCIIRVPTNVVVT